MKQKKPSNEDLEIQVIELRAQLERETALRRQAEDAERDGDRLFRSMIDLGLDVIFILSSDGIMIHTSASVEQVLGYKPGEIVGKRIFDLLKSEDVDLLSDTLKECSRGSGMSTTVEHRFRHKDGSWRIMESAISNLMDNSIISGILVNSRDVTERRRVEWELRNSEERYRTLFEGIGEGILLHDTEGIILDANAVTCARLGYSRDELVGMNIGDIVTPEASAQVKKRITEACQKGNLLFETTYLSKDGGEICCEVSERVLDIGGMRLLQSVALDITERKRAEAALRKSEDRYRTLFESSPSAIALVGMDGKFIYVNNAATELTGYSKEELQGKSFFDFKVFMDEELPEIMSVFSNMAKTGEVKRDFDLTLLRKDGEQRIVETCNAAVKEDGKIIALQVIINDITERKSVEAEKELIWRQLLQAQKMDAIGRLAGGLAHEFNNMLAVIMGNTELALGKVKTGSPASKDLRESLDAAGRVRNLTMRLLTFARMEKVAVAPVSVNEIIGSVKNVFSKCASKKISIETMLQEDLPPVEADANQIEQALLNICNNAQDAMVGEGATITIETRQILADEEYCKSHPGAEPGKGKWCLIQISDTGHGMSEEVARKIFEPFFTTKGMSECSGLGLTITYGILKNHGGHISVHSVEDEGTVVSVYLPFSEGKAAEYAPAVDTSKVKTGHETILIVDDEQSVLRLAAKILKKAGYKILTADSGTKGVRTYKKHREEIALVLLGMTMPNMDGGDVYCALKDLNPDIKVVITSGYSLDDRVRALLSEGVRGFVQKPFTVAELCNTIRQVLVKTK